MVMNKAREQFTKNLWTDSCIVYETGEIERPNGTTGHGWVEVLKVDQCHVSFQNFKQASQSESIATVTQVVRLFLSSKHKIKEGSKIVATRRNGEVLEYYSSGKPAPYDWHQQITLSMEPVT